MLPAGRTIATPLRRRQKVAVAIPLQQDVSVYFELTGNMAAINTVDLVARVQGFVQAISYTDGDFVKKGTSLFTIEPEPYRLKVEAAKAAVTSAQATLKQNEAEYQRQADLVTRQVSTQANYDKALAARDSAQADLQSAKANEQQAEINLGYTNVTAPFDGIVSARQVSIGQLVGANSADGSVHDRSAQSDLREFHRERARCAAGARRARASRPHDAPICWASRSKSGCKRSPAIRTRASSTTWRRRSILRPERSPRAPFWTMPIARLLPGYFVRVRIASQPEPALLVSDVAIGSDQGGRYVLVVNKDNVVEQRKVEPGQLIGELRVIDKGLTKDDRVVIGGIMRAIPGQKVEPELRPLTAATNNDVRKPFSGEIRR